MTYGDVMSMHVADALWFRSRLFENLEEESQAIAKANSGG